VNVHASRSVYGEGMATVQIHGLELSLPFLLNSKHVTFFASDSCIFENIYIDYTVPEEWDQTYYNRFL
jgi:hypothetical protein